MQFIDLVTQKNKIRDKIDQRIKAVLDHGKFIMGPEVTELESKLSDFTGAKHVITCSNGTDALFMALIAKGVGPGDAIIVPNFTFIATAEVVSLIGATPVFVDVYEDTFNMDPESLKKGIVLAKEKGLKPKGLIAVDLFGQPAEYDQINKIAKENNLFVIADGAQACGAEVDGKKVGTLADITTTSFFPAKPLGCYGDGGAIFTDDDALAEKLISIRVHGKGTDKYDNVRIGLNGRINTIQAAILLEKLAIFPEELTKRQKFSEIYSEAFKGMYDVPVVRPGMKSAWAQYTLKISEEKRPMFAEELKKAGIPCVVYYVKGMNQQGAYKHYPSVPTPVSDKLTQSVLSIPMHPYLENDQERVIKTIKEI